MKINVKNTEKLNEAISNLEGQSYARTMTANNVQTGIKKIEQALKILAIKSEWKGCKFRITNGGHISSSYFGVPFSTFAVVEYFSSGWFVTDIYRAGNREDDILAIKFPACQSALKLQGRVFKTLCG